MTPERRIDNLLKSNNQLFKRARKAEAALKQQKGYKLVPIEPTEPMIKALLIAVYLWLNEVGEDADVYKAILDAAP